MKQRDIYFFLDFIHRSWHNLYGYMSYTNFTIKIMFQSICQMKIDAFTVHIVKLRSLWNFWRQQKLLKSNLNNRSVQINQPKTNLWRPAVPQKNSYFDTNYFSKVLRLTVPRIIDQFGRKRCQKKCKNVEYKLP